MKDLKEFLNESIVSEASKTKIQIKSINGKVLFEHECDDNTIMQTVRTLR